MVMSERIRFPSPALRRAAAVATSLAAALALASCGGSAPPPANMPPPLAADEAGGIAGRPYSDLLEPVGEPTVASGPVAEGDTLIRIPFRYRHTAVLTQDVLGYSFTVRGVRAPAGSPGYYAGRFSSSRGHDPRVPNDMWCFFPSTAGEDPRPVCFLRNAERLAAIAPTRLNPYLWSSFSPATGTFDYVRTPIFERRAVELPVDLALEYRFRGWTGNRARVELLVRDRSVTETRLPRGPDGAVRLPTPAGDVELTVDPAAPNRARVRLVR